MYFTLNPSDIYRRKQVTEKEAIEAKERADLIVDKMKDLVNLEDQVLETRATLDELRGPVASDEQQNRIAECQKMLGGQEAQLKERAAELNTITAELEWATPCFKGYVLPQMSEIVGTLKSCDTANRQDLVQLVTALSDEENAQSSEQLEQQIIARLRENLERTFSPVY
jgi:hypothetical protein